MSARNSRWLSVLVVTVVSMVLLSRTAQPAPMPIDVPTSSEPRVLIGKCLTKGGFWSSQGLHEPFKRLKQGSDLYTRDVLVSLPGFQADVEMASKGVQLTLYGNLPEVSESHCLESAVILHDTSHYEADFTLLRGRVVVTNTKKKGPAKFWIRTAVVGVQFELADPGDKVALEIYGRWAPGVPFSLEPRPDNVPTLLWDVLVLKGSVDIKAGKNEYHMSAPPGRAYFHGDSVHGPAESGPERVAKLPRWADPEAASPAILRKVKAVAAQYQKIVEENDADEVFAAMSTAADKDEDKERAALARRLLVFGLAAMDDVARVTNLLETSKRDEVRKTAVIALRHWIGAREGRDEKLFALMLDALKFRKPEAETVMGLLHSPFGPEEPETFETLIRYLAHSRQSVRELAHWHLVRLAPGGRDIEFDAAGSQADREKAVKAWQELIPKGKLPTVKKKDEKKDK